MNKLLSAEASLALLRQNATRLVVLTEGQPPERLQTASAPDEWSPNEVLAHMRACCDVWGGNIARIMADDHPTFPGMNPRSWMPKTDYADRSFGESLRAFEAQREALLGALDPLAPEDWERTATVTSYGQAHERSLRSYASQLAKHERTHVRQLERILQRGR